MSIEPREYTLPDARLVEMAQPADRCLVWQPQTASIVLGHSSRIEQALFLDQVIADNIPIFKRPSGGETVLLSPKTLVISAIKSRNGIINAGKYFTYFNERIIRSLASLGVKNLHQRGISDITLGDRKVLGSAIYQNKDLVFYHAVLNVAESPLLMEKYIRHPEREPDYRSGRKHRDFVTSLECMGYNFNIETVKKAITGEFGKDCQLTRLQH